MRSIGGLIGVDRLLHASKMDYTPAYHTDESVRSIHMQRGRLAITQKSKAIYAGGTLPWYPTLTMVVKR